MDERNLRLVDSASLTAPTVSQDPSDIDDHGRRSAYYLRLLARRLGEMGHHTEILTNEWIETLCQAMPLHDIGKVAIPDHILHELSHRYSYGLAAGEFIKVPLTFQKNG
jgi:response regulator RpfG family c-di-GMP phosphodiesterase